LDKPQHEAYEKNLLQYWEMTSAIDTAFEDGIEQGIEQERLKTIKNMLAEGLDIKMISHIFGLSIAEIEKLKF